MTTQDEDDANGATGRPVRTDAVAVAVRYDAGADGAPHVTASGRGALAERILELAFSRGVRVREDADLAQLLSIVEVGEEIPLEAFHAVAEVLAYVYRANGRFPESRGDAGPEHEDHSP